MRFRNNFCIEQKHKVDVGQKFNYTDQRTKIIFDSRSANTLPNSNLCRACDPRSLLSVKLCTAIRSARAHLWAVRIRMIVSCALFEERELTSI